MENYIGKVIHTDTLRRNYVVNIWERTLIPLITKLADSYNNLGIGSFNQAIYKDMMETGIANVEKKYSKAVSKDIEKLGVKTLAATLTGPDKIKEDLRPISKVIDDIKREAQYESSKGILQDASDFIFFDDCEIIEGCLSLKKDQLNNRFEVVVENEKENQFYNLLLDLVESHNKLREFVDENKHPLVSRHDIIGGFVIEKDGVLEINGATFKEL